MPKFSRTAKSIKNAKVALFFYVINLILQFFSRKIFLEYLGAEVLGLNTTAQNLLGFLNIAELGISSAISYTLYQPLFKEDRQSINEIVSIQGWLYRKIALIVIIGACVLMFFFPLIFAKMELPIWYAYSSFLVLLVGALLGYFINYRQIVLVADQKEYQVTFCVQGGKCLKVILQIAAIALMINGYIYWLVIELLMAFVIAALLHRSVRKEYVWLDTNPLQGKYLKNKYPGIIKKTKQLFIHKIAAFVLSQTSPLIIYAYTSLGLVAIYGNYMLIVSGVVLFINSIFNSISAGVGSLIAEGNKSKIKSFYWQYFIFRYWITSVSCFGVLTQSSSFIKLWVGEEYILPPFPFILLVVYTFIVSSRINDLFIVAYGMYQDIWAAVLESILNIGCSIVFGYYWGLKGIISGVVLSLFVVVLCWKPYFLFKIGFKDSLKEYWIGFARCLGLIALSLACSLYILRLLPDVSDDSFLEWGVNCVLHLSVYIFISLSLFLLCEPYFRDFLFRLVRIVKADRF